MFELTYVCPGEETRLLPPNPSRLKNKSNQFLYSGINSTDVTGNLVNLSWYLFFSSKKKNIKGRFLEVIIMQILKSKMVAKKCCRLYDLPGPQPQIDSCSCTRWGPNVFTQPRELF